MHNLNAVLLAAEMEPRLFDLDFQLLADSLLTIIAVFVLFIALSYLLFNPARKFMQDRQNKIAGELDHAKTAQEDAEKLKADYEARLANVDKEADEILSAARAKALANEADIVAKAREEASRIIAHAHVEAELEKKKAADEIKQEMVGLAMDAAGKFVRVSMDDRTKNALMAKLVSQVYAEALFGLGVENGLLDTLLEELNGMCEILGKNPQFVTLLGHPELDQKEKTAVFDRVFDGKISKELNGFCHLLLEKGRFGELFAIREDYERRCLAYHKIGVVYVTSAEELSDTQKENIRQKLLATTDFVSLQIHYQVDAALIGGLKIQIGDRVVDSSIQNRLKRMKDSLMRVSLS